MPKLTKLDERVQTCVARLVDAALTIKMETGIGEPEFTTALARALVYRLAISAPPGQEGAMLDHVIAFMRAGLPGAVKEVDEERAYVRERLRERIN